LAIGPFTSTGWKNFVSKFAQKSGDKRTEKQLKNKLDGLKEGIFSIYGVQEFSHWSWMGRGKTDCCVLAGMVG
jgi:hypothetical protein